MRHLLSAVPTNWLFAIQQAAFAVMLIAILVGSIVIRNQNTDIKTLLHEGQQAHAGLCVLKADLRRRIEESENFIEEHPRGFAGVPISIINQAVAGEQSTLAALKLIVCPGDA